MGRLFPVVAVACLLVPTIGVACLWDYDTLKMEQARFPDTLELITGKFLRHSPEFYRWRIADRLKRLESDPNNLQLLDDLAVAYDKVGEHDKAIATAERTERIKPQRYETAANLGSFLFHSGRLKEGLPQIDRALAINPNAHFGREKYQKLLVEYVLKRRAEKGNRLPLAEYELSNPEPAPEIKRHEPDTMIATVNDTFENFLDSIAPVTDPILVERTEQIDATRKEKTSAALKGVLGMMKFGDHKSPILLEALGTLLLMGRSDSDAKLLSCRAFLKASYEVPDGPARIAYRAMAKRSLMGKAGGKFDTQLTLAEVEPVFKAELVDAQQWYEAIREKELAAIRDGRNPEADFDKLYIPELPANEGVQDAGSGTIWVVGLILAVAGAALFLGWLAVKRLRHTR